MGDEKLFPKQVEEPCHSWMCKGVLRAFERVNHVSVEQPVFDSMDRISPATGGPRLPFAHQEPTSFGMCVRCGTVRFIGPTLEEVDAHVKRQNEEFERQRRREEEKSTQRLADTLEEAGMAPKRADKVARIAQRIKPTR